MTIYERVNSALRSLEKEERPLKELLEQERASDASALFEQLVKGVLENKILLDALLSIVSKLPLKKYRREEYYYLLIGSYAIVFLDKPDYAIVSEIVQLVKRRAPHRSGAFNAMLRRISREKEALLLAASHSSGSDPLSVKYSVSPELTQLLLEQYSRAEVEAYYQYAQRKPALDICVLGESREQFQKELRKGGTSSDALTATSYGLRLSLGGSITDLPGYEEGSFYVMGHASQMVCEMIPEGERLLDLCAAPGGKSIAYKNRIPETELICCDIDAQRVELLKENLSRAKMEASVHVLDGLEEKREFLDAFDLVLLDAPCTASGLLARHPELRHSITRERLAQVSERQSRLLRQAARYVRNGGFLIYCTCSILRQEGIAQIDAFLRAHGDFSVKGPNEKEKILRTRPWEDDCDGFFAAVMKKESL